MKYIAYCRKSTDEKDKQVLSIDQQLAELTEFAKREKLEIVNFVVEAKTAKTPGREKFAEVLKLIERGVAQGILSWHHDRLARNSIDGGKIIYLLDIGKLHDLKFPTFWFDNTPQGKFMLNIAFGQSKYYVDNLSENVVRGMRYKVKNGIWPVRAPLGYFNEPKLRTIEVNHEKEKIVKKAFQLFAEGNKSFTDISNFLHKNGVARRNGKPVKLEFAKRMLSNRFYVGIMKYAGEYYEGKHKTFITRELFDKAQKEIGKILKPKQGKHNFAFCGLIKCRECGASITGEIHKKYYERTDRTADYIYYRCTKKIKPCSQKPITKDYLEEQIRLIAKSVSLPLEWEKEWQGLLSEDEKLESVSIDQNIGRLELELQQLDEKLNKLLDGYLEGVIESETYKTKKNELFEEKVKVQEDISRIKSEGSSWLEPFKEFTDSAFSVSKIARAKNTSQDLGNLAKTVGSNFFLENRLLSPIFKKGFDTLFSEFVPHANSAIPPSKFLSVDDEGLEPPTSSV